MRATLSLCFCILLSGRHSWSRSWYVRPQTVQLEDTFVYNQLGQLYLPISYNSPPKDTSANIALRRTATARSRRNSYKEDAEAVEGKDAPFAWMTTNSYEHKALVSLLRERGTILEDERVPEDELFYEMPDRRQYEEIGGHKSSDANLEAGGHFLSPISTHIDMSGGASTFDEANSIMSPTKSMRSNTLRSMPKAWQRASQQSDVMHNLMPLPDSVCRSSTASQCSILMLRFSDRALRRPVRRRSIRTHPPRSRDSRRA